MPAVRGSGSRTAARARRSVGRERGSRAPLCVVVAPRLRPNMLLPAGSDRNRSLRKLPVARNRLPNTQTPVYARPPTKGRVQMRIAVLGTLLLAAAVPFTASAATSPAVLRVSPPTVNFGTKPVGSFTLKGATVTNTGAATVNLLVTVSREPDDFSFGVLPGSTCPVFEPAPLAPGEHCDAVVGFRPSEFFAGQKQ